jgi:hypothetical protein
MMRGRDARCVAGALVVFALALGGCASSSFATADKLQRRASDLRIVLMPIDITLAEVTTGGMLEANAAWTATGKQHLTSALNDYLRERNVQTVAYSEPSGDADRARLHTQLVKLHGAVGLAILHHQYSQSALLLPTKKDRFDWSMGPDVAALGKDFSADYALFIHVQDSYASSGRVAMQVAAVFFGVAMQGGMQLGFASLVDLKSGEVVWFNRLIRAAGDLREAEPAKETVRVLLDKFPT